MKSETEGLGRLWKQPKQQTKYSDKEVMEILDNVAFPKGLTIFQTLKIIYWSLFERRRLNKFCESIHKGKSLYFSLKDASNV